MSLRDIQDYRRLSPALAGIGAYTRFDTRLLTDGPPIVISRPRLLSRREVSQRYALSQGARYRTWPPIASLERMTPFARVNGRAPISF
jgi:hypothetical protein